MSLLQTFLLHAPGLDPQKDVGMLQWTNTDTCWRREELIFGIILQGAITGRDATVKGK